MKVKKVYGYRTARLAGTRVPREAVRPLWELIPESKRDNHIVVVYSSGTSKFAIFFSDDCAVVGEVDGITEGRW